MAICGFIVHDREGGAYALTDSRRATLAVIPKNARLAPKCSAHALTAASPATSPLRFKNLVRDRKLKSPPPDPLPSPRFGDSCRFRKLDSSVSMVEPAKDRIRNNVSEPLDRPCARRVLPKRNVSSHFIVIGSVFRKIRRRCSALTTFK